MTFLERVQIVVSNSSFRNYILKKRKYFPVKKKSFMWKKEINYIDTLSKKSPKKIHKANMYDKKEIGFSL